MRKIKFRGKRLDNGEWVYGDLLRRSGETYIIYEDKTNDHNLRNIVIDSDNNPSYPPVTDWTIYALVDPETVGQYTGLKDKHNKEIYEGDLLSVVIEGYKQAEPYIVEDMCDLYFECQREDNYYRHQIKKCEIIGNKYENPIVDKGGV